jgi:hypothetical protein
MFDGGKTTPEPQEKKQTPPGDGAEVRVFAMPEELRGKEAMLHEEAKKEEPLQPLIIPVVLPPEPVHQTAMPAKKRVSPALLVLLVLVLMAGTGAGVWWYVSTYAAPPQVNEPTPEPEPEPEPDPEPEPKEPYPGTDTDSDGLTNVEELLYGTDFRSPDTDGDTFLDGNEVFHRYDPNGLAPSTLLDTGAVRVLERADLPFTIYYPASWTVSGASSEERVIFRSADSAAIELAFEEKDELIKLDQWMKAKGVSTRGTEETMTKQGYSARSAEEGRMIYLDVGSWVISATYELGEVLSIEFLQTFKMMMNSVHARTEEVVRPQEEEDVQEDEEVKNEGDAPSGEGE